MDDPEIKFGFFPLRDRSTIDLLAHLEEARVGRGGPDPFASRAWALRVAEIQRELAIRNRRETERQDALPPISIGEEPGDGVIRGCPVHDGAIHGGEAEELRAGIEEMIAGLGSDGEASAADLQRLLDRVNARDSLGYLERQDVTAQREADLCEAYLAGALRAEGACRLDHGGGEYAAQIIPPSAHEITAAAAEYARSKVGNPCA